MLGSKDKDWKWYFQPICKLLTKGDFRVVHLEVAEYRNNLNVPLGRLAMD
ncbi:hypothetical protein ACRRTK_016359 [Alexandromys fortis]